MNTNSKANCELNMDEMNAVTGGSVLTTVIETIVGWATEKVLNSGPCVDLGKMLQDAKGRKGSWPK